MKNLMLVFALAAGAVIAVEWNTGRIATAQERILLTAPETAPSNLNYRLEWFTVQLDNPNTASMNESLVTVQLMGIQRELSNRCTYRPTTTPSAATVWDGVNGMNRRNFSTAYAGNATTGAMIQALFHRLVIIGDSTTICDRPITGTLTGTPQ